MPRGLAFCNAGRTVCLQVLTHLHDMTLDNLLSGVTMRKGYNIPHMVGWMGRFPSML